MNEDASVVLTAERSTLLVERDVEPVVITPVSRSTVIAREDRSQVVMREEVSTLMVAGGNQGPPGVDGIRVDYVHTQASPALTWTVNHNLGFKPSVELRNSGDVEYDAEVIHTSINQLLVYHDVATAGTARLT